MIKINSIEEIIELGFNCVNCIYYWEERRYCVKVSLYFRDGDDPNMDMGELPDMKPKIHICAEGERLKPHPYEEDLYSFVLRERYVHEHFTHNMKTRNAQEETIPKTT